VVCLVNLAVWMPFHGWFLHLARLSSLLTQVKAPATPLTLQGDWFVRLKSVASSDFFSQHPHCRFSSSYRSPNFPRAVPGPPMDKTFSAALKGIVQFVQDRGPPAGTTLTGVH